MRAKKKIKEKLSLSNEHISIIKNLLSRDGYNDQMVQAIFSQLGRTINHREIGYIRTNRLRYATVAPARDDVVDSLLVGYRRAAVLLRKCGVLPADAPFQLVQKAHEAMLSAIMVFNNPNISFRSEIFITNAVIAWTYLAHAYFLSKAVAYWYEDQKTDLGGRKYHELGRCLKNAKCPFDQGTKHNLEYLIQVRHEIEHRMAPNIDAAISSKVQACALNFDHYIGELFGAEFKLASSLPYSIQLSQLTLGQQAAMRGAKGLPEIIEVVNKAFEAALSDEQICDPRYSYRIFLLPRTANRKNSSDEAVEFVHPESLKGKNFQVVLKQVEKSTFLPSQIVKKMRSAGHRWFRMHEFTQFWKKIDGKNPAKGFGVNIAGSWYWYQNMVDSVAEYCAKEATGKDRPRKG